MVDLPKKVSTITFLERLGLKPPPNPCHSNRFSTSCNFFCFFNPRLHVCTNEAKRLPKSEDGEWVFRCFPATFRSEFINTSSRNAKPSGQFINGQYFRHGVTSPV